MKKKLWLVPILMMALLVSVFSFPTRAHALNGGVGVSNPGQQDVGNTFNVSFSYDPGGEASTVLSVSVSGGGHLAGVQVNPPAAANGATIVCDNSAFSGVITVQVDSEATVNISVGGTAAPLASPSDAISVGGGVSVPVRTAAEKAEAERIAAEQARIDASIRAEQDSKAASEAAIQSSIDASIAESVSIEESISQSEYDSSVEESNSIREESESISLVEKTRAFEMYDNYFVPFEISRRISGNFYFATADTVVTPPENFVQVELERNMQQVLAFRNTSMSDHQYLVYGTTSEKTEPGFYFYDSYTDTFFSYEMLTGEEIVQVEETEEETVEETEETEASDAKKGTSVLVPVIASVIAFLVGAAAMYGILLLLKNRGNGPKGGSGAGKGKSANVDSYDDFEPESVSFDIDGEDAGVPISESVID